MDTLVFDYTDYRSYLLAILESRGRGERSRLSEAIRCHPTYMSQVLGDQADFSLEQAEAASVYIGHSTDETDYFLLLTLKSKAGSASLKGRFEKQLEQIRQKRLTLSTRLSYQKTLSQEAQTTYYSSWHYAAIHMTVAIPQYRSKKAISRYLDLPLTKVAQVLEFLVATGLVKEEGAEYNVGSGSIHLGNDSSMISKHHTNWRLQAIQSLDSEAPNELHYSSVLTLTRADVEKIKSILVKSIESARSIIRESKEECLFNYSIDWFEVGRQ